tara:strand:+ start:213 stop:800 length:588 start_codon:yes stop_codon:yes gene_type:complete
MKNTMLKLPKVRGTAAVYGNAIALSKLQDNNWSTVGKFMKQTASSLDFIVLRTLLSNAIKNEDILVMGQNVRNDMRRMIDNIVKEISDRTHYQDKIIVSNDHKLEEIKDVSFRMAMRDNSDIFVLGGVSVYDQFEYDEFVLTEFKNDAIASEAYREYYCKEMRELKIKNNKCSFGFKIEPEVVYESHQLKIKQYG